MIQFNHAKREAMGDKRRKWTPEEIEYLEKNYATVEAKKIAKHLGRTLTAVRRQAANMGIMSYRQDDSWTKDEVQYLCDNLSTKTHAEISQALRRTRRSVSEKARALGLIKPGYGKRLTADQRQQVKAALIKGISPAAIACEYNLHRGTVNYYAASLRKEIIKAQEARTVENADKLWELTKKERLEAVRAKRQALEALKPTIITQDTNQTRDWKLSGHTYSFVYRNAQRIPGKLQQHPYMLERFTTREAAVERWSELAEEYDDVSGLKLEYR